MKYPIQLLSDLHLERRNGRTLRPSVAAGCETLFLAGDIGYPRTWQYDQFFNHVSHNWKHIFYVPGNHEYDQFSSIQEGNEYMRGLLGKYNNVTFLYQKKTVLSIRDVDYCIYGTPLWADCRKHRKAHFQDKCWLWNELVSDRTLSRARMPALVITHYLPSYKLISEKYRHFKSKSSVASNSDFLFHEIKERRAVWACGHSHDKTDEEIYGTRCLRNSTLLRPFVFHV